MHREWSPLPVDGLTFLIPLPDLGLGEFLRGQLNEVNSHTSIQTLQCFLGNALNRIQNHNAVIQWQLRRKEKRINGKG